MIDLDNFDYENYKLNSSRKKLTKEQRAAQFLPFDGLEGYSDSTYNKTIIYDTLNELSDDEANDINLKIEFLLNNKIEAIFIYFDELKNNKGFFKEVKGILKYINYENNTLVLKYNKIIPINKLKEIKIINN